MKVTNRGMALTIIIGSSLAFVMIVGVIIAHNVANSHSARWHQCVTDVQQGSGETSAEGLKVIEKMCTSLGYRAPKN